MGSRRWFKVHSREWIEGTLREETSEIRGVWIDLLALATSGQYGDIGEIKLQNGVGLSDTQICEILAVKPALWRKAKQRLLETDRIEISPRGAISIVNWRKYQSEYDRQKPYRKKRTPDSTSEPESPLYTPLETENEIENDIESYT